MSNEPIQKIVCLKTAVVICFIDGTIFQPKGNML